ncbi:FN3 associated domain-containing protein [Maribellus sediminis]|uniref:FN3 associated domain-containing protein n=1 Tax=Maribellus sediminis TaxID=2696285 RepID=UPI00142FD4C4|nr:chitobiase/beta-hexosaminidase C-terminal domain-containing protein [Maribellus sediminis]
MKINVLKYAILLVLILNTTHLFAQSGKVIISEFMAINSMTLADEDGDYSDWIELYNPGETDINLEGWFLTDKADNLMKWKIPSVVLKRNEYLVIFASEKKRNDPANNLHTNFKLSGSGEFLAICEPDSSISFSYSPMFPAQRNDVSYGLYQNQYVFFSTPTPGAENVPSSLPFSPSFSVKRGFYTTPVDVALSSPVSGSIYYTLDGTRPNKTTGTLYSTPIHVEKTTPLSAVVINDSDESSEIVTNTYWFIEDILKQPVLPEGYPADWKMDISSTSIKPDYEMDPEVCEGTDYKNQMEEALTSIPSISIVTTKDYLFSSANNATTGGIYIYTGKPNATGKDWVRPTSVEYYDPKTGKEFQLNCRLKLHGGNSRNPSNSLKHGFEFKFSSSYGPSKLNFNLFDEEDATNEFNSLVLRAGYNYSWALMSTFYSSHIEGREKAQYLQDPWTKTTQLEMGNLSGHERFAHLYINGLYWGLYNVAEEYTNDFAEEYLKGKEEDFDIIKEKQEVSSGTITAFNALVSQMTSALSDNSNYQKIQGKNADGSVNASYQNLLEVENYIDYMLLNYYIGNKDWNKNNWVMMRNRNSNEEGFRFLCWDAETSMTDPEVNIVREEMDAKNPAWFIQFLMGNKDFKVLFADRVKRHMQDEGGALTPSAVAERYNRLADEIDMPIIGESARWGDCNIANQLYTKNDNWLPRKEELLSNYFPVRTDIVIQQLKDKGYLNSLDAPVFSHAGGEWPSAINLNMGADMGEIYYTTDGSDPREQITSATSASAALYTGSLPLSSSVTITARTKSGNEWSAVTTATYDFVTGLPELIEQETGLAATNYPNPFNRSTTIAYSLPKSSEVEIDVYTIDGHWIDKLYSGYQFEGEYSVNWSPQSDVTGMFIYRIKANEEVLTGKMIRKK